MGIARHWGVVCGLTCMGLSALAIASSGGPNYAGRTIGQLGSMPTASDLQAWIDWEKADSITNLFANISPQGAASGAVVASPSTTNPNYFKHWVRDASLTMNLVISFYENTQDATQRATYYQRMMDFASFSRKNQLTPNLSGGLGEPLFMADGSAFNQPWGRPQNDGPAIRAFVLTRWANDLINEGQEALVRSQLYDGVLPTNSVIKSDLEYVAHNWQNSCYDLWEEVHGYHFYTRMVQRKAMLDGAALADRLGDMGAAAFYRQQAGLLETQINTHWDSTNNIIQATLGRDGGIDYKSSGLDSSVILGVMHADTHDGFFPVYDDRAVATAVKLANTFKSEFPINQQGPGIGIGRYPEDQYTGYGVAANGGDPWVLLTNGFAEYYYRVSKGLTSTGTLTFNNINQSFYQDLVPAQASSITPGTTIHSTDALFTAITAAAWARGDDYLSRTRYHTGADGVLYEQMNRNNGFMQGAYNLTWSDASFLVAAWERSGF